MLEFIQLKRALDVVVSFIGLAVFAPLIALLALVVAGRDGLPVLFRQHRPGLHGKPFTVYKLRTMRELRDVDGQPLPDDERLDAFGAWVRSSSLDELPELWNVLKGDMSLVGPRPLLMHYLPLYDANQARRHEVRPGLTGLAQVSGRNATTWEERLELDVWYVDHHTMRLDLQILAKTIGTLVRRDGISASGHATMPEFNGPRRSTGPGCNR